MNVLNYFAYGSNLHPLRLISRVPSARLIGQVPVSGYQLCFHKRHQEDGSGKCNMFKTDDSQDVVLGVIYSMQAREKPLLDRCEGPGYRCDTLTVHCDGKVYECFVYLAEDSHIDDQLVPHCWYRNIVLLGAEFHRFPPAYIDAIRRVHARTDPNQERHLANYRLIDQMNRFSAEHADNSNS